MFFTYIHRKVTDNSVFYVGCGRKRRITVTQGFNQRSEDWHKTVAESGFYAEVVAQWDSREDALSHEKLLISCFKDMGHPLVNKPIGVKKGEIRGPHSESTKQAISAGNKGKKRKPFSDLARKNMSEGAKARHAKAKVN